MSRKKSKAEPITKRYTVKARMPSGDPVSIQISATIRKPKHVKLTPALLSAMVRAKAESSVGEYNPRTRTTQGARMGKDPTGVKLRIIRWRNPERKGAGKAWRTGGQAQAWGSLRRALARAEFTF